MPTPSTAHTINTAIFEYLIGASVTIATGGIINNAQGEVGTLINSIVSGAGTVFAGKTIRHALALIGKEQDNELFIACCRLSRDYRRKIDTMITPQDIKAVKARTKQLVDLVTLGPDSDAFYKKYDKRYLNPYAVAKAFRIDIGIAKSLCDRRPHWQHYSEAFIVHLLVPTVIAGAIGFALPIPSHWLTQFPTLVTLLQGAAGKLTSALFEEGYETVNRHGFFSCGKYRVSNDPIPESSQHGSARTPLLHEQHTSIYYESVDRPDNNGDYYSVPNAHDMRDVEEKSAIYATIEDPNNQTGSSHSDEHEYEEVEGDSADDLSESHTNTHIYELLNNQTKPKCLYDINNNRQIVANHDTSSPDSHKQNKSEHLNNTPQLFSSHHTANRIRSQSLTDMKINRFSASSQG